MRRTIVVGDVHGCAAELDDLLATVGFGADDALVFVGDLVARGPETQRVLRRFRELRARACRGNHEQRLLDGRMAHRAGAPLPRMSPSHRGLLDTLSDEDWATLESLPFWIELPDHGLRVVHAGFVAGVPMEAQDPWVLLHMRSFDDVGAPTDRPGNEPWAARYGGSPHVAFGHDARRGLQLHPHATGLDTACVYGERLSALVLKEGQFVPPVVDRADVIVSVEARGRYYVPVMR